MGCLNVFLVVWLIGWSIFLVVFLVKYLTGGGAVEGDRWASFWHLLFMCIAEVVVACVVAYSLFARQSFRIETAHLTMETDVLGFKRSATIARDSIKRIVQEKDGGEGEDSFPSWGLKLEGEKGVEKILGKTLIHRQPYEKSRWLGGVLAKWAGVDFIEAPKP